MPGKEYTFVKKTPQTEERVTEEIPRWKGQ